MSRGWALIVDDEPDIRELLQITLTRMDIQVKTAADLATANKLLGRQRFDLCLTDMMLPDGNGLDLVDFIQHHYNQLPVAVITAHGSMDAAIRALKSGAFDFVSKPVDLSRLRTLVDSALKLDSYPATERRSRYQLLGDSTPMQAIRAKILKLSRSQAPVYISGESGTGKELVARLIHAKSPRGQQPFIAVNCGAIPPDLAESEFFGHKKGSFSGAIADKNGLFQAAEGGTLFLDEIADLPLSMQVKLLRAIQEKRIRPVGDIREIPVDVRILSATHKNLAGLVQNKSFREDLFYRINVIELAVPPLREHREDIRELACHILDKLAEQLRQPPPKLSANAQAALLAYGFPGNVRELENILERALALCDGNQIDTDDLALPRETGTADLAAAPLPAAMSLENYMDEIEKNAILQALEKTRWNKTAAAEYLGISFRALRYRLKKLGVD